MLLLLQFSWSELSPQWKMQTIKLSLIHMELNPDRNTIFRFWIQNWWILDLKKLLDLAHENMVNWHKRHGGGAQPISMFKLEFKACRQDFCMQDFNTKIFFPIHTFLVHVKLKLSIFCGLSGTTTYLPKAPTKNIDPLDP